VGIAPDGSPVDVYALLPELGEGDRVARAVPAGGSILELGCGAGRITRQLVRLGYRVTAVDESEAMLAHVDAAETICARIEGLDLGRHFDAVLLASNLITAPAGQRRDFLETCRRHADLVVVEGPALGWQPQDGETQLGDMTSQLRIERFADGTVHGSVEYAVADGRRWRHSFAMRVFADEIELDAALAEAGLRLDRWLDEEGGRWFVAVPAWERRCTGDKL
jgi:SAM-dependent methyltransferase